MSRTHQRRGFTLVELMVALGVIVVLLSLILPTLNRAREMSKQTSCLGNLRNLGTAFMSYVADNEGLFPRPAVTAKPEDWLYWQAGRDTAQGRLVPYLGGAFDERHYRCPSDSPENRTAVNNGFLYSYTINENISNHEDNVSTLNLRQIVTPAEKVLLIDESSDTVDDGCWAPQNYAGDKRNLLSNRHVRPQELRNDPNAGMGCVAFADGHAGMFSRSESFKPRHYDPTLKPNSP